MITAIDTIVSIAVWFHYFFGLGKSFNQILSFKLKFFLTVIWDIHLLGEQS